MLQNAPRFFFIPDAVGGRMAVLTAVSTKSWPGAVAVPFSLLINMEAFFSQWSTNAL